MKTLHLSIIVILATSLVIVSNNVFADTSTEKSQIIVGTVSLAGCHVIGGALENMINDSETEELCHYGNKYLKIITWEYCILPTAGWTDPENGKYYAFDYICDIPTFYDPSKEKSHTSTTTILSSSAASTNFGLPVTFTATVSPSNASGIVQFNDTSTSQPAILGTGIILGGTATFTTSSLSVGSHNIVAKYLGDTNNPPSISTALTQTVNHVTIDGTVTPNGCHLINGIITQATDIQNTIVQICNYNNKHFKLTEESLCGATMEQAGLCDIPVTCGTNLTYLTQIRHGDKIPRYEGSKQYIDIIYPGNMCVSEAYNEQEKKITIITNGSDDVIPYHGMNYSKIDVIIPTDILGNVTVTIDGKKSPTFMTSFADVTPQYSQSDIEIDLPFSVTKKIEITGDQKIPEFPIAITILLIGIVSVIVFYRVKLVK
jgi:hypothetical protein